MNFNVTEILFVAEDSEIMESIAIFFPAFLANGDRDSHLETLDSLPGCQLICPLFLYVHRAWEEAISKACYHGIILIVYTSFPRRGDPTPNYHTGYFF